MSSHTIALRITVVSALFACSLLPALAQDRRLERTTPPQPLEKRWALVIGNSGYPTGQLKNPVNDAQDMAELLHRLGFGVNLLENAGHQAMEDAIRTFSQRLREGGVGLFYFAGHGVQFEEKNFLIPVDADIVTQTEIPFKSVELEFVLAHMGEAAGRLNIVILDACRDNPFPSELTRGGSRLPQGLAQFDAPTGTIIGFATGPGKVAADGKGRNGLFTQHLLAALDTQGLTIEQVLKRTRRAVASATDRRQVPWTSSSLLGDFVPRPIAPPVRAEAPFSLEHLDSEVAAHGRVRQDWDIRLRDMQHAFEEVDSFEEGALPAYLKAEAWDHFLDEFNQDNPFSTSDNTLRAEALTRRELWDRESNRISGLADQEAGAPSDFRLRRRDPEPLDTEWLDTKRIERPTAPPEPEPEAGARWREPLTGKSFHYVPTGRFAMGSPRFERGRDREERIHDVTLTRGFWIAGTELTQGTWYQLFGSRPSYFDGCDECPVEQVNWYEAVTFANLLSESAGLEACYGLSGCRGTLGGGCPSSRDWCFGDYICQDVDYKGPSCEGFRLPTEAEWEYAARASTTGAFGRRESLSLDGANIYENQFQRLEFNHSGTTRVASFEPNDWGLFDVHGNVLEWTWDFMAPYPRYSTVDPTGPFEGERRVVRGGSWKDSPDLCRSASRRSVSPGQRFSDVGIRLVKSAP